ncbi:hypothetical protein E3O53_03215 [Cryobacterium sp. TMT2-18-3]|nr:hypothetical protein E3O22_09445 [Cryobacterium sp. TMT2-18-2]TFC66760.1 hypothetical protein E3O53_03215 [Cryobacterium sp. TMT2-18-3]
MKRIFGLSVALVFLVALFVPLSLSTGSEPATAANGSDFDPGYIISDENFYAGSSMSQSEIQSFLNNKSSVCAAGYTCIKDYRQSTWSRPADAMCASYQGGSNETSAAIIAKVAQACKISPKVLLVTLQKEQSLISASAPSAARYDRAMGYACPDTAPCDAQYFGFYNQVYNSAWQFKRYANPPGTTQRFTWFPVGAASNVLFHPNSACGSTPVRIRNAATAALYYYTPYQPNGAAMGNLYGSGDACSAYGNRNFWRMYTDWFGSTSANGYGSFDSAIGVYKGIAISGWSIDPNNAASAYAWVNVDGQGGPVKADKSLSWFDSVFPGFGPNHGFAETIAATAGDHEVCVYGTYSLISCKWVTVPAGQGSLDTVVGTWGGADISGWAVDFGTVQPSYIWVNVDGVGSAYKADVNLPWINSLFAGAGADHGFKVKVPAAPGARKICAYGIYGGVSELISCRTVTVPRGTGALDSATSVPGGLVVSGWSADYTRPDSSFVWVDVDGNGSAYRTNKALSWLPGYLPGIGQNNGFEIRVPARKGSHRVCVSGAVAQLGCRTVTVEKSADGHLDSVEAVAGGVRIRGWSVDLTTSQTSYIWVNVNGEGGPFKADAPLSWFESYYPGSGPNHGFDVTVPKPAGTHTVCVNGTEELLGCQTVTVP